MEFLFHICEFLGSYHNWKTTNLTGIGWISWVYTGRYQDRPWPLPSTFHFIIHSKHTIWCHLIWFTMKHPVQPHAWQSAHWFMNLTSAYKYINWHVSLFQAWSLVNIWRVGPVLLFHYVPFFRSWGLVFLLVYIYVMLCYMLRWHVVL